jgi:DNA-binding response OmpR family regulator
MNEVQRILIVDDEPKIVEVIKSYLENSGFVVSFAYNGKDGLKIFEKKAIDLIILDLMLPDISGEEMCKTIRLKSRVPIIMLTAKVIEENIVEGLNIGADDYMTKPFSPKQLVARVNAILRRVSSDNAVLSDILSFNNGELVIDNIKHEVRKNGNIINLTLNEYKFLITLAKNPSRAFTRDELIDKILGYDFEGYDRAIDTHIKNLRHKIEDNTKEPTYILTIYGVGYRFGGDGK